GIPRELMGLSYGKPGAYGGQSTIPSPEEIAKMLRRHLIALGPIAALPYDPLTRLAKLLESCGGGGSSARRCYHSFTRLTKLLENVELPGLAPVPLPSRLFGGHVAQVRNLARRLHEAAFISGSDPEVSTAAAAWASRLLHVPGSDAVKKALMVAVAQLHIEAGWAGFDAGLYDRAMIHYACAVELGIKAGDAYCQAVALSWAGLAIVEHGHPNDGLKMLQYAGVTALGIPSDPDPSTMVIGEGSRVAVQASVQSSAAPAYDRLGSPALADADLTKARELWTPTPADINVGGDLDRPAACLELARGRLDVAEPFAVASVRRWEGVSQVGRTQSAVVLATIHVRAGEPRGLQLAHDALTAAGRLTSIRVRQKLEPLAIALEGRRGSDARELARQARQVALARV
ncbi:MAG: hypothetical protein M3308_07280, partial [Actinomycetota bacterium]|nr:hypothetical protein [Actinomycetota bacterium]